MLLWWYRKGFINVVICHVFCEWRWLMHVDVFRKVWTILELGWFSIIHSEKLNAFSKMMWTPVAEGCKWPLGMGWKVVGRCYIDLLCDRIYLCNHSWFLAGRKALDLLFCCWWCWFALPKQLISAVFCVMFSASLTSLMCLPYFVLLCSPRGPSPN